MIINGTNNHQMISKDIQKNKVIKLSNLELENLEIPQSNKLSIERVYLPNWLNRPNGESISIRSKDNNTALCKTGGSMLITAGAGVGKSSIVEAIVSSALNIECDSLGVQITLPLLNQKVLILDTERSQGETWDAWLKMMRRTNIIKPIIDDRLIFANCKSLSVTERQVYVSKILSENQDIGLVVFDGAGDFVNSVNNEFEVNSLNDWVNTFSPLISIIHTLHTNPNDPSFKPRGWLGSELWRRANSVLVARKVKDCESEIVELTSDFENGKIRHGKPFNCHFSFNEELEMFASIVYTPKSKKEQVKINKETSNRELLIKIWGGEDVIKYSEMINRLMKELGKDKNGAINYYKNNIKPKGFIEKIGEEGWKIMGLNNGVE